MFSVKSLTVSLLVATLPVSILAQDANDVNKIGWTGTIRSLDGGFGGKVEVIDTRTLRVTDYTLEEASAPALYWWGSTTDSLRGGFRISNTQLTERAEGTTITVSLDAGKTTADFRTVGVWCERFDVNFGETTLAAVAGAATGGGSSGGNGTSGGSGGSGSGGSGSGGSPPNAAPGIIASSTAVIATMLSAVAFTAWLA